MLALKDLVSEALAIVALLMISALGHIYLLDDS